MRSLCIILAGMFLSISIHAQEGKANRQETKAAIEKYVNEQVNPVIEKEYNSFLEALSPKDKQLVEKLKTEKAEMLEKRKMRKGFERKPSSDIPKEIDRDAFHKLMKERKLAREDMREEFKWDIMYLSHKYDEALKAHMDKIAENHETWAKEIKEILPEKRQMNQNEETNKMPGRRMGADKKMKRRGDVPSFLLWDGSTETSMKLTGIQPGRKM